MSVQDDGLPSFNLSKDLGELPKEADKGEPGVEEKFSVIFSGLVGTGKCSTPKDEAINRILNGEAIAQAVVGQSTIPIPTKENCRDLIWYLTALSFQRENSTFPRGTIRLVDESSERIEEYLSSCEGAYTRISSHYNELKIGNQRGINFDNGDLPYDELKTVLFGKLQNPAKSEEVDMFFKMETAGFNIIRNPRESAQHSLNWMKHLLTGGGKTNVDNEETHRETDIQDLKKAYRHMQDVAIKKGLYRKDEFKKAFHSPSEYRFYRLNKSIDDVIDFMREKSDSNPHLSAEDRLDVLECVQSCVEEVRRMRESYPDLSEEQIRCGKESIIQLSDAA